MKWLLLTIFLSSCTPTLKDCINKCAAKGKKVQGYHARGVCYCVGDMP